MLRALLTMVVDYLPSPLHAQLGQMEGIPGLLIFLLQNLKEKLGILDTKVHCHLDMPFDLTLQSS